jgi:DNA-binding transcriptional MerR regulator
MMQPLTIGKVSECTGVSIRTIRFYESEGVLPAPARTKSGYRLYSVNDVRRLRLIRNARVLGLGLPEIRTLVDQAFASECNSFAPQLHDLIRAKREDVTQRIADLHELQRQLDELEQHVSHAQCATEPGQMVAECGFCPLIDEEGGTCDETAGCGGSD